MPQAKTRKKKPVRKKRTTIPNYYGWAPDLPDQRDYLYAALRALPPALPRRVDLRSKCSKVEDQKRIGSCTANALAGAVEFLERKALKDGGKLKYADASRLFIYYNERVIEHCVRWDTGAQIRDGIKTLAKQGVCTERSWPYVPGRFATRPPVRCYQEALDRQITSYHRILTLDEMRACLAEGYPFVFGFTVYEGFESKEVEKTGVLNMPQKREKTIGGHAVMAVGYNDNDRRFIVRNSWGPKWGMQGYFTMPYDYVSNRNLSDDFWTIRKEEMGESGKE